MLTLHFAPNSRAVRVAWLFAELDLPYELNAMRFHPEDLKSDAHRERHPLGRIPVLEDDGQQIWESGAIVDYILECHKNGGLKPAASHPSYGKYLQWFHYCEGMVMPSMNTIVVHTLLLPPDRRDPVALGQAQKLLSRALLPLEAVLSDQEYLIGDFSGADIMLGHACIMSRRLGCVGGELEALNAYIDRLESRPAWHVADAIE